MPLSEHNFERHFLANKENQPEKQPFAIDKKKLDAMKADRLETQKKQAAQLKKITPENAHALAVKYLPKNDFKKMLKSLIGELIVRKKPFTRMDTAISQNIDYEKQYGISFEHFEDIENGNLTSFDLIDDDGLCAITFKKFKSQAALRYIDDKILAKLLKTIFASLPSIQQDLLSGLTTK
jgi:hypothetical protein